MRRAAAVLALAAVLLAVPASALYAETDPVVQATSKTFDDLIVKPDGAAIVEFYAPCRCLVNGQGYYVRVCIDARHHWVPCTLPQRLGNEGPAFLHGSV